MSLYGPGDIKPGATALDVMAAFQGVRETGPNRGPWVDMVLRFVGLDPAAGGPGGYAWCCAGMVWCLHRAGHTWAKKTASVSAFWEAHKDRVIAEPEIGDAFIHLRADGKGHCGLVRGKTDSRILTIECNTNAEGSREGNAIAPQSRVRGPYFKAFIRIA